MSRLIFTTIFFCQDLLTDLTAQGKALASKGLYA